MAKEHKLNRAAYGAIFAYLLISEGCSTMQYFGDEARGVWGEAKKLPKEFLEYPIGINVNSKNMPSEERREEHSSTNSLLEKDLIRFNNSFF